MDHESYWYQYLLARHHTFFVMGIVLVAAALIFTLTGWCLVKYKGFVSRSKNPKMFWQNVVLYFVLGLVCLGLWAYTAQ